MIAWFLFVLLFNTHMLAVPRETRQPKCKNPKGKLWSTLLDKDCGQSVCRKKGKKGVWEQCPRPATQDKLEEMERTILSATQDNLQEVERTMLSALAKLDEKFEEQCGYQTTDESCFPEESRGCPPKENLRIVRQEFDTLTKQEDHTACWNHCKDLYGTPPHNCIAWTFDSTHQNCYTYKTLPACYNTAEYSGWYSGQESCEIDVSCFPGESDRGCPPKENLRIVRQPYDTFSRQANYTACWDHCRELQADSPNGCFAWTFSPDTPEGGCFTYNSLPACYNTGEYPGWWSGQESCP